jgi:hypothetical protein
MAYVVLCCTMSYGGVVLCCVVLCCVDGSICYVYLTDDHRVELFVLYISRESNVYFVYLSCLLLYPNLLSRPCAGHLRKIHTSYLNELHVLTKYVRRCRCV